MSGFGLRSRLSGGFRTVVGAALGLGIAFAAVDLSGGHYARFDLSLSGRNTLDAEVLDLIDQLPEPVVVDVFFRPLRFPYDRVSRDVIERLSAVLQVARESRRAKIEVRVHGDGDLESAQLRQKELGVEGVNIVVFSTASGSRKSVAQLFGDVAVVDWGNPTRAYYSYLHSQGIIGLVSPSLWRPNKYVPARVSSMRSEEVLVRALLNVSSASSPRVYFSTGEGEPSLASASPVGMSRLFAALSADGFEVREWNPHETPEIPSDCVVLALIGPRQPFPDGTLDRVREYIAGGGQVIGAPAFEAVETDLQGGVIELLFGFGMAVERGIVCEPLTGAGGEKIYAGDRCAQFLIDDSGMSASHPLTEPLRRRNRRLQFSATSAFSRGGLNAGGLLLDLATTSLDAWRDMPLAAGGFYDFEFDYKTERRDRHRLIMAAELPSSKRAADGRFAKGRVLGIGSATFLSDGLIDVNRDFLLNAFNWMSERTHRIRVSPLPTGESRLDLERSHALSRLAWTLYLGLPGLCLSVGLVLAWRRRN